MSSKLARIYFRPILIEINKNPEYVFPFKRNISFFRFCVSVEDSRETSTEPRIFNRNGESKFWHFRRLKRPPRDILKCLLWTLDLIETSHELFWYHHCFTSVKFKNARSKSVEDSRESSFFSTNLHFFSTNLQQKSRASFGTCFYFWIYSTIMKTSKNERGKRDRSKTFDRSQKYYFWKILEKIYYVLVLQKLKILPKTENTAGLALAKQSIYCLSLISPECSLCGTNIEDVQYFQFLKHQYIVKFL